METCLVGLVVFLVSLLLSLFSFPYFIRKLMQNKIMGVDVYKIDKRKVAERGGLIALSIAVAVTIVSLVFTSVSLELLVIIVVVCFFGFHGLIDDVIGFDRLKNLVLPFFYPLFLFFVIKDTVINIHFFGAIDLGMALFFIVIVVYVAVCSNLINLHAGFNGMSIGTAVIILFTLFLKFFIDGKSNNLLFFFALLGSFIGFLWFNKYPARVFEGNVGTYAIGAAIGIFIVMQNYFISGLIMLFPHIVCFLMDTYGYFRREKHIKFGIVRIDGTIKPPNPYELSWVFPYYFRMKEKQITFLMLLLTSVFCLISLFVPF